MARDEVEALARSLLYEGYLLYPYRPRALKNRHRFTFGGVYPPTWCAAQAGADAASVEVQGLVRGAAAALSVEARFLHFRQHSDPHGETYQDAVERRVALYDGPLDDLLGQPWTCAFESSGESQQLANGELLQLPLAAAATLRGVRTAHADVFRFIIGVANTQAVELPRGRDARDRALLSTLGSLHLVCRAQRGELISLLEPAPELEVEAEHCVQRGLFPVLVGTPGQRDTLLASPIVLYDYPRVASESSGDHFDATEIDEMLSLRILTLTDDEKAEIRQADTRAAELLERTERLSTVERARLHGAQRRGGLESISIGGRQLTAGDRVRIMPRRRADAFDLALAARSARVESVEVDFEGRVLIAVTVDDDPGADLGRAGWPGHRFFFGPEEVELLP